MKKAFWISILTAAIVIGIFPGRALAGNKEDLSLLTRDEIDFLLKHTPEISHVAASGAAVVYGRVIEPPILITINEDRIHIGGIQVTPRPKKEANFRAQKKGERIHEQFFKSRTADGPAAAEAAARKLAIEMGSADKASRLEFSKGKVTGLQLKVGVDGTEWESSLEWSCPPRLLDKYLFMIRTIVRAYTLRKKSDGAKPALEWLHARFADLEKMGVISSFEFSDDDGVVRARPSCTKERWAIGFYSPQSPRDFAREKRWKAKEPETKRELDRILNDLKDGQLLIYAHDFEKKQPLKAGALDTLKSASSEAPSDRERLKSALSLTTSETSALEEELP